MICLPCRSQNHSTCENRRVDVSTYVTPPQEVTRTRCTCQHRPVSVNLPTGEESDIITVMGVTG